MSKVRWILFFFLLSLSLHSASKYPVDLSFLIADMKFNEKQGVKICEVQHGILSTFYGDRFTHGEPGVICGNFYNTLLQYHNQFWTIPSSVTEFQINALLSSAPEWHTFSHLKHISKDPLFSKQASLPVFDPYNIHSYHGCLFVRPSDFKNVDAFLEKHPGIIVMDRATFPYWVDKYKMTELFAKNETLASFKPKWGLYSKQYTPHLANQIVKDIGGDIFVIKPRGTFLGNGVIIVKKENLDTTLKYILLKNKILKNDPDRAYHYWDKDPFDSFIIEEFIESDPIVVKHLENKLYQPSLRVAFLLVYHQQEIYVHYLGAYWNIPPFPLSAPTTMTNKHKTHGKPPNFSAVAPETLEKAKKQLDIALPLLYEQMLEATNP